LTANDLKIDIMFMGRLCIIDGRDGMANGACPPLPFAMTSQVQALAEATAAAAAAEQRRSGET